ncbi:MAG: formate--tetrahydrofolate ligase [Pseudomonadota bacterium]
MQTKTDIEISRNATIRPIQDIGAKLDIPTDALSPYGHDKAKVSEAFAKTLADRPSGRLILVTAINPTPAGEGKTTTTVGLGDGLNAIGKNAVICIREASLGPCFGVKGGAAGGGYAQVVPMEAMNLHFTGDLHAVSAAHNLLAAMIDNHIHWGNALDIDPARISWPRVMDMNERALRAFTLSPSGKTSGPMRDTRFDITAASEVMAILCLATDLNDLRERLAQIVVAFRSDGTPILCRDLSAHGAMTVLLKDALQPNLVQTLENNPAFVHGGPFANIAHGCSSIVATKTALKLADYVVTEAGFGADLGAEKFFNIKCRKGQLSPSAVVLVATIRALKMNGGAPKDGLSGANETALRAGCANLGRHIENLRKFGVPVIVAINHFQGDSEAEIKIVTQFVAAQGVEAVLCKHWAQGSAGILELANKVVQLADAETAHFTPLYADEVPLLEKIGTVAQEIYRAGEIVASEEIRAQLADWDAAGYGHLPVCIAKTPYSFSADQTLRGVPEGFPLEVRAVRLNAGAGFVVAQCGDVMTMPGLPRHPAAETIELNSDGETVGLF